MEQASSRKILSTMKKMFPSIAAMMFLLASCEHKDVNIIDTIALVVPSNYHGSIIIFYDQDYEKGKIEFRNGKHFIYTPDDGIVFTRYILGDGHIEKYDENLIEKNEYGNTMNPQLLKDSVYDVIGGAYGGINLNGDESNSVRFSLFRAGLGKEIKKDTAYLFNENVRAVYEKKLRSVKLK
jgi:hypothetical protein